MEVKVPGDEHKEYRLGLCHLTSKPIKTLMTKGIGVKTVSCITATPDPDSDVNHRLNF